MPIEREGDAPPPEHELPPYSRVARFRGEEAAGKAYGAVQALLYRTDEDAALPCYRFQLNTVDHVAVVATPPPRALGRHLARLLAKGEPAVLPEKVLALLHARGVEERANAAGPRDTTGQASPSPDPLCRSSTTVLLREDS